MIGAALHALGQVRALPLAGAIACYLLGVLAIGVRLRAAAHAVELAIDYAKATAINLSGVLASHLAFGGAAGEVARGGWLVRAAHGRPDAGRRALAALAVDRVADGLGIAALAACVCAARATVLVALAPLVLAGAALIAIPRMAPLVGIPRLLRGVRDALPGALAAWALDLLRLHLVAVAVGTPLSLGVLGGLALAALVGGQAPTPGGIGAVEAAMGAAGTALGVPGAGLVSIIVVDRALSLVLGTALGALASAQLVRSSPRRIV